MYLDGTKSLWGRLAALVSWCSLSPVLLAGEITSETPNFTVVAESPLRGAEVGQLAEGYRREIALEWLGRELPAASERTLVQVRLSAGPSQARTLVSPAGEDHHIAIASANMTLAR